MQAQALDGLIRLFRDRVLSFDTDAGRHCTELAVQAKAAGKGLPLPDGYIAAISALRGFIASSRDIAP
jgi:predicted nucleic acid-binding protein